MVDINLLNANYILWLDYGSEGWKPTPFTNLNDAVKAEKYSNEWLITRRIKWEAREIEE